MVSQKLLSKNLFFLFIVLAIFSYFFPNFGDVVTYNLNSSHYYLPWSLVFHLFLGGLFLTTFYLIKTNKENSLTRKGSWTLLVTFFITLILSIFFGHFAFRNGEFIAYGIAWAFMVSLAFIITLVGFVLLLIGVFRPSISGSSYVRWKEQSRWFRAAMWVSIGHLLLLFLTAFSFSPFGYLSSVSYNAGNGHFPLYNLGKFFSFISAGFEVSGFSRVIEFNLVLSFLIGAGIGWIYDKIKSSRGKPNV